MPRIKHTPTPTQRTQAEAFAMVGVPHHDIAVLIGISTPTLLKHYRSEMDRGKAKANAKIGQTLFSMASKGNSPAATIYWTKSQMGWREVQVHEISGRNGKPIKTIAALDPNMTITDAAKAYKAMLDGDKP